jgi:hypothetical protein
LQSDDLAFVCSSRRLAGVALQQQAVLGQADGNSAPSG